MAGSIEFLSAAQDIARVNYSVPLPGSHQGKRLVRLDLGLAATDWAESELTGGTTPALAAGIHQDQSGKITIDPGAATTFLRKKLTRLGYPAADIDTALAALPDEIEGTNPPQPQPGLAPDTPLPNPPKPGGLDGLAKRFVSAALEGLVLSPLPGPGGSDVTETVPVESEPDPQLFLVEKVAISSFLGDYGMGKTVKTFTLLPGESTTIRVKTWQSTKQSRKESSSIIDSHETEAKERFETTVQNETTDKSTKSKEEKWSVEAEASATWGWGSASVKGSASGEYQSGREQFAKQVSSAVGEHAKTASSKRELSVTSESEVSVEEGSEEVIERTITNVNVRRVLNFVFRELNQEYHTHLHLTDIHVAYTNGMDGVWREVPISGLRGLLAELVKEGNGKRDEIARQIVKFASVVFDGHDEPVRTLELVTYDPVQDTFAISPLVKDADGLPDAPTENQFYRFKKGNLAQDLVPGVLLSTQNIVMRTDSVIVEALLGESDALDAFAMEIQGAAATEKTLANQRESLIQDTLAEILDPEQRATLAAALFAPHVSEPS
ncbi:MAG: hypothetical protein ACOH1M_00570 [Rhodoglobus sp.]